MPPIDLQPGKDFIEEFMVDTCEITRDSQGILDDTLNTTTGLLERPGGDTTTVYTGKCLVKTLPPRQRPPIMIVGEGLKEFKMLRAMLPLTVVDVQQNDIFTVTASANDPRFLGRSYIVTDVNDSSNKTYRALILQETTYMVQSED